MDNFLSLANRTYEVVVAILTSVESWGIYLTSPEFDKEQELRNKVGTIWICSLLDTLDAKERFLPEIAEEAKKSGHTSLVHNCAQLQNLCALVGEVLNEFSREEQILLTDLRNQLVHGYLTNRHQAQVSVKYVSARKIVKEKIANSSYYEIVNRFYLNGQPFDQTLAPLIARALNKKLRYWDAIAHFQKNREAVYSAILNRKTFEICI